MAASASRGATSSRSASPTASGAATGAADPETLDLYGRQADTLKRILEGVGLKRRPRDATPDLSSYIEGRAT